MKAIVIHNYGGPEELKYEDAPEPQINPDDVLIKVFATSVNPVDWKLAARATAGSRQVPGRDLSGIIDAVIAEPQTVAVIRPCDAEREDS